MTHKITLLSLVPALALGLSACGSSNTDAGASPSSSSTSMSSSMPMPSDSSTTSKPAEPSPSTSADASAAVISIADFAYKVPATVAPGTKITIKNADSQAHTVTSKDGRVRREGRPERHRHHDRSHQARHLQDHLHLPQQHERDAGRQVTTTTANRHGTAQGVTAWVLPVVVAAALVIDAVVHLRLAGVYQQSASGGIGVGNLFRIEAVAAVVVALWVL